MNEINISNPHMTKLNLSEDALISYGDIFIQTMKDDEGNECVKIMTDNGYLMVLPQTGNSIIVKTTKKKKNEKS